MDLERALETQRVKLLRLLTGWIAVAGFVSGGSFVLPLPQELRRFFNGLLIRAELAGQYLARASESLQSREVGIVSGVLARPVASHSTDDAPSSADLVRRMVALRDLLESLTWMLRKPRERRSDGWVAHPLYCDKLLDRYTGTICAEITRFEKPEPHAPRAERPPDPIRRFEFYYRAFTPSQPWGGRRKALYDQAML